MTRFDYSSPELAIRTDEGIIFLQQLCPETRKSVGIDLASGHAHRSESFLLRVVGVTDEAEKVADGEPNLQRLDNVCSDRVVRVLTRDDGHVLPLETIDRTKYWVHSAAGMSEAPIKQIQSEDTR